MPQTEIEMVQHCIFFIKITWSIDNMHDMVRGSIRSNYFILKPNRVLLLSSFDIFIIGRELIVDR